ncbi:glycosyltransferase [Thioalkalivibrio sulfidiphilus]|uniref:glycosyltransferase n=1 Tax=Thioalkalivibrio sulfidiphilus TaxID=1033854 RepID=UPI0003A30DF2|nr:glycosyltransferase [Thioalkalivibrio sulfidiphilus]
MSGSEGGYSVVTVLRFTAKQMFVSLLHTKFKSPLSRMVLLISSILWALGRKTKSVELLLKSRRISKTKKADYRIRNYLEAYLKGRGSVQLESLLIPTNGRGAQDYEGRTLILRLPLFEGNELVEKGVIIIKFSETCGALYQLLDVHLLAKYFRIVLEPSWVGYSLPEILVWSRLGDEKVILLTPYQDDFDFISGLESNLVPITLGPADWVDPNTFKRIEMSEKKYDCIYVANFDPMKRVDRYLRAVVRASKKNKHFRACLVCAGHGTARSEILEVVKWAKSKANVDFFEGMQQSELNKLVNQSKVNVLVSLREGANKGLAEGLWADVPALLIKECACGNQRHINDATGKLVADNELERELLWFSDHYGSFKPRSWVDENIDPRISAATLNAHVQRFDKAESIVNKRNIVPKVNKPELAYLDEKYSYLLDLRAPVLKAFSRQGSGDIENLLMRLRESSPY